MRKIALTRISKIGMAIGFSLLVGAFALTSARAEDHGHHHGGRHLEAHYSYGRGYVAPVPSYYYAPPVNYYTAPEPAYYYDPQPVYNEAPQPSQGRIAFLRDSLAQDRTNAPPSFVRGEGDKPPGPYQSLPEKSKIDRLQRPHPNSGMRPRMDGQAQQPFRLKSNQSS
jgi:hypothetical protein